MSGYIPIFGSVYDGSLHGKWPTLPVWLTILPLADKNGHIDLTPEAIAARTGWPLELLLAGIKELCEPDPRSRSKDDDGRRLVLIANDRDWGWRIVNHAAYREKARKQMQQIAATESGRDADRKRIERERKASSEVRRSPALSSRDRLSDSDSDSDSDSEKNPTAHPKRLRPAIPAEFLELKTQYPQRAGDQGWRKALRAANARIAEGHTWTEILEGAKRYAAFIRATGKEGSEYVKQAAGFLGPDKPFAETWIIPPSKPSTNGDDPAARVYETLLASGGKQRDAHIQAALDQIPGGWSAIQGRTPFDQQRLRRTFCDAYRQVSVSASKRLSRVGESHG